MADMITGYEADPTKPNYGQSVQVPRGQYVPGISATPVSKQLTAAPAPTPTTPAPAAPTPSPTVMDPLAFQGIMQNVQQKLATNNNLTASKTAILNAIYNPGFQQDLSKLDPATQAIIQRGNKDEMDVYVRSLNDQINGYTNSLNSSIQYLTTGYNDEYKLLDQRKQQNFDNVMKAYETGGSGAFKDVPSSVKRQLESQAGLPVGYLDKPSIKEQEDLSGKVLNLSDAIKAAAQAADPAAAWEFLAPLVGQKTVQGSTPTSTGSAGQDPAVANSNPGNIKVPAGGIEVARKRYNDPEATIGSPAADGGYFIKFSSDQKGQDAIPVLLQQPMYQNKTVDQAMKLWGQSAGASGIPDLANKKVKSLTANELQRMANAIQVGESKNMSQKMGVTIKPSGSAAALSKGVAIQPSDLDPGSQSILAQTGLSIQAFQYLTQGATSLARLDAKTRANIQREAQDFANKNGIDLSTFASRYTASNQTLQDNIKRFNNVQIAEGELKGTIDNLDKAAKEAGLSDVRATNAVTKWLKGEYNDADVQKYAFHLNQLQSEMAFYNAATQGRNSSEKGDMDEANNMIKQGIAGGSLAGMKEALQRSVDKMDATLQASVDRSNKQVWSLFGVGDRYKDHATGASATTTQTGKTSSGMGYTVTQ